MRVCVATPGLAIARLAGQPVAHEQLDPLDRAGVLLGAPIAKGADAGPTVCACFGVGRNTICNAIREQGLSTSAQVTSCVKAGGNCGSCVPEIRQLIAVTLAEETANA